MEASQLRRMLICFFLFVWILSFLFIGSRDLLDYRLQSIGVDAWVTFGTAEVGLSASPDLMPTGDVFSYNGKLYPAKQPGQFILGAIPYSVIKLLGYSYEKNYFLAASFVGALTSCLFTALVATLMLRHVVLVHRCNQFMAYLVVAGTFVGSQWYVYSSISHHDILAGCMLLAACILLDPRQKNPSSWNLLFAGLLLGLALCTSMLPAAMVATVVVYLFLIAVFFSRSYLVGLLGFCIGLLPIFAYNLHYFGSPWTPPNIAGGYNDTYPALEPLRFVQHLNMYLGFSGLSQFLYAPISYFALIFSILLGLLNVFKLPLWLKNLKSNPHSPEIACNIYLTVLCWTVVFHLAYICSIETLGTCSYGPRYLLPTLPITSLVFLHKFRSNAAYVKVVFSALLLYGFAVNFIGKLYGSIVCALDEFSFLTHLHNAPVLSVGELPMLPFIVLIVIFVVAAWLFSGLRFQHSGGVKCG